MKKLKTLLIFSLTLNLIASFFVFKRLYWAYQSKNAVNTSQEISYWLNRDEIFEKLPKDTNSIIFLGNSLTENFELSELFKNVSIKNRGISGDNTAGVLNRLSSIIGSSPKKLFIEIGINDLARKIPIESVLKNYQKIIDTLKTTCPQTELYLQSILPVANSSNMLEEYCSPIMNQNIRLLNESLMNYSENKGVTFVDLYSKFEKDGQLNPVFTIDGVHLTGEGYILWTKILKPFVDK